MTVEERLAWLRAALAKTFLVMVLLETILLAFLLEDGLRILARPNYWLTLVFSALVGTLFYNLHRWYLYKRAEIS